MAHFAIVAPPLPGHYWPYSSLAAELVRRRHQATFFHHEDARALVQAPQAGFVPVPGSGTSLESWVRPMAKIRGLLGLKDTIKRMEEFTDAFCREGPQLLRQYGIDAVIADQLEPAGGLVAEHLGLPWITIASTLPMNRERGVPPPFVNWRPDASEKAMRRNEAGWRVSELILRSFNRAIARNATALGLPRRARMEDCFSPTLQLAQLVRGVDFPRAHLPATFAYVGAFGTLGGGSVRLPSADGRLTAYCTLGTLQGSRISLFEKIAAACEECGVRLVITHGGHAKQHKIERLPGKPLVYDWLPQKHVLGEVDLVICHGGMGTVLDTLSAGVPLIVLPLAFEQPGIAARVAHSGAGLMLSSRASPRVISKAVETIFNRPRFRARAQVLGKEIRGAGGVALAADLIEKSLGLAARTEVPTTQRAEHNDARGGSRSGSR